MSQTDMPAMAQPHRLQLPQTRLSRRVDGGLDALGRWVSWIWVVLLAVIVANVIMRYLFDEGRIEFEEIQWHLYAMGFLIGLSYGYVSDAHIRVDIVRERLAPQTQAWIELYGTLLLLVPFVVLVLYAAWPFVLYSFQTGEISQAPGGLPYRWVIKATLLAGFVLLSLGIVARLTRITCLLFGWPADVTTAADDSPTPAGQMTNGQG